MDMYLVDLLQTNTVLNYSIVNRTIMVVRESMCHDEDGGFGLIHKTCQNGSVQSCLHQ